MKAFLILFLSLAFAMTIMGCGVPAPKAEKGAKGDVGAPGNDGSKGDSGSSGSNGHSVLVETTSSVNCSNGGTTVILATDANDNGTIGAGDTGLKSFDVCNGAAGSNGLNAAPTPFTPVAIIDPCGDTANIFDEVFLKLANGTLLASFSDKANGQNTRWSILVPGNYITTDGSNCHFTVTSSGNVQ